MKVDFYSYNFDHKPRKIFTLGVVDGEAKVTGGDPNNALAKTILSDAFPADATMEELIIPSDGDKFLELAAAHYSGSRVRAEIIQ